MKKILITNDDGIKSPGLKAAVEAVVELGEVIVVAPTNQQTAMSRSLRSAQDAYLQRVDFSVNGKNIEAYHCDATPAMIVQHAFNVLFHKVQPDLVISGINYGENLGYDAMLSGTVGAAFQGAAEGVQSIAVSLQTEIHNHMNYGDVNWEGAKHFLKVFTKKLLKDPLSKGIDILKIDVPAEATENTEWKLTKLAKQHYYAATIENACITSKIWDTKVIMNELIPDLDIQSDIYALVKENVVAVTPLIMDMSAGIEFEKISENFK